METHAIAQRDLGFSLVELLVVMVVCSTLVGIAVPLYMHQRQRAHDTSTQADLNQLAKEVATYYVDGHGPIALDFHSFPGKVLLTDAAGWSTFVNLTNGTAAPSSGASARMSSPYDWCVALTDNAGGVQDFRYSPATGMERGTC